MIEYVVRYRTNSTGRIMYESSNAVAWGATTSKIERARRWTDSGEARRIAALRQDVIDRGRGGVTVSVVIV